MQHVNGHTDYWFDLPEDRIALRPMEKPEDSKLLVVRGNGTFEDTTIAALPKLLRANDVLVTNTTKVLPAALKGVRHSRTEDGKDVPISINLVKREAADSWIALAKPAKRLRQNDVIWFSDSFYANISSTQSGGKVLLRFNYSGAELDEAIQRFGNMPIPPYIAKKRKADAEDIHDYQSIFAKGEALSVAAPTASFHFSDNIMNQLAQNNITTAEVCLHVGMGTFAPLSQENFDTGTLHSEWRSISGQTIQKIESAKEKGGKIIAIGSTAMRTLESATEQGRLKPQKGPTDIFIQPGFDFKVCDGMLTNFHLPASSLFILVCAFMGTEIMQKAYKHAIERKYRFYSYGDACLLLP